MSKEEKPPIIALAILALGLALGVGAILGRIWYGYAEPTQLRHDFFRVSAQLSNLVQELVLIHERTGQWPPPGLELRDNSLPRQDVRYQSTEIESDGDRIDTYWVNLDGGVLTDLHMDKTGRILVFMRPE